MRRLIAVMAVLVASGCGVAGQGVLQSANGAFEAAKAKRGAVSKLSHGLGCRLSGLKRLVNDDRALMAAGNRSQQVDLRRECSPISDQGVSSACVVSGGVNPRFLGGSKLGVQISLLRLRCHAQH